MPNAGVARRPVNLAPRQGATPVRVVLSQAVTVP